MSTFHSDMEQSSGLFVCFCKTLMYFYGVRERAFQRAVLHSLQERTVHGLACAWIVLPLGTLLALTGGCRGACVQGRRKLSGFHGYRFQLGLALLHHHLSWGDGLKNCSVFLVRLPREAVTYSISKSTRCLCLDR